MTKRSDFTRPARVVDEFVKSHRVLWVPAGWLSRMVASSSPASPIGRLLGPLRNRLRDAMGTEDVLGVMTVLEAHRVPICLAGGWGVDALLGRQSRAHHDLDIVVDDYDSEVTRAIHALEPRGFRLVAHHERRAWMPKLSILEDDTGHRVELVSLDWDKLARALGPPGATGTARQQFEEKVFAEGTVGGRRVPCLSAEVQLLYHIGFELGPDMHKDMALVRDELGAALPDPSEP